MGRVISRPKRKTAENVGRAECPFTQYSNPLGPIIRQCKVSVVRKLSNRVVARAEIFNYRPEYSTEILLIVESFIEGKWIIMGSEWFCEYDVDHMRAVIDRECIPCELVCVRAYFFVNRQGIGIPQEEYLGPVMLWNVWGRNDGIDEQRYVDIQDFYDEEEYDDEYPFSLEEEEYYETYFC